MRLYLILMALLLAEAVVGLSIHKRRQRKKRPKPVKKDDFNIHDFIPKPKRFKTPIPHKPTPHKPTPHKFDPHKKILVPHKPHFPVFKFPSFPKKFDFPHKPFPKKFDFPHKPFPKKFDFPHKPFPKKFDFPHKPFPKKFDFPHKPFPKKFDFPHKPFPKKFDFPHKPFPKKFVFPHKPVLHDPHKVVPHKKFSLGTIPAQLEAILASTETGIKRTNAVLDLQGKFDQSLQQAISNQKGINGQVKAIGKDVSKVVSNTKAILAVDKTILAGQGDIKALVSSQHAATRTAVAGLQKSVSSSIGKVFSNQAVILKRIAQGQQSAQNGFANLLKTQSVTQSQLRSLVQVINDAGQANLNGQAGIVAAVRGSRDAVIKDLGKVIGRQGAILNSLDASKHSVEKRIESVFARQNVIISAVKASQRAVQSDLAQFGREQSITQGKVKDSEAAVRNDIAQIRKFEAFTQHILAKCKDNVCDVSGPLDLVSLLSRRLSSIEGNLQKEIRAIHANEDETQGLVEGYENNILAELDSNADDTLAELKGLGKELSALLSDCKDDVTRISKDTQTIENTQQAIEHALIKMHQKLDHLDVGKGFVKKSRFGGFGF